MPTYNNRTIVLHELIGLSCSVKNCTDRSQIGIHGTVIDETKNSLLLKTEGGERRLIKQNSIFAFKVGRRSFVVDGKEINFRSEDRIEKGLKFYKRRRQ